MFLFNIFKVPLGFFFCQYPLSLLLLGLIHPFLLHYAKDQWKMQANEGQVLGVQYVLPLNFLPALFSFSLISLSTWSNIIDIMAHHEAQVQAGNEMPVSLFVDIPHHQNMVLVLIWQKFSELHASHFWICLRIPSLRWVIPSRGGRKGGGSSRNEWPHLGRPMET